MIEMQGLTKKFGDFTAVDHIDLEIRDGEFFGLLGPNGAGKTTTISMLSTVLLPTEGRILLDGKALDRRARGEKRRISVITQEYSMRQDMTMEEVMEYQGRLYFMKRSQIRQKTEELLKFTGLLEYRRRTVRHLSGGMKRKLMICRALMTDPDILLLDEPTAGMDALSRRQTWALLRKLQSSGMTVLLTTHYMEEAIQADRVFVMDNGKIAMQGSPREVFSQVERMQELHLDVPQVTLLGHLLRKKGLEIPEGILTREELSDVLKKLKKGNRQ